MGKSRKQKKPYSERSDLEKIKSIWNKTKGLYDRGEYSSAIIRAATAVEIATNMVIREELERKLNLDEQFVNSLLIWCNGVHGKFNHLIIPLFRSNPEYLNKYKALCLNVNKINIERRGTIIKCGNS